MTHFTRGGSRLTTEQFIALSTIHGIFGGHFLPEYEEANKLDWELIENPAFMKDVFDTIESLPEPCSEIFVKYYSGKSYKEIGKDLKIRAATVEEYLHKAWRLLRHPRRSKAISHYATEFRKLERESYEEDEDD